jgi:outer membrane protein assembly factor BamD
VARFYYDRDMHVAAINRCKYALENFPRTPATEDALGIMTLSYQKMGITQLYNDTLRILKKNFPKSHYLRTLGASAG